MKTKFTISMGLFATILAMSGCGFAQQKKEGKVIVKTTKIINGDSVVTEKIYNLDEYENEISTSGEELVMADLIIDVEELEAPEPPIPPGKNDKTKKIIVIDKNFEGDEINEEIEKELKELEKAIKKMNMKVIVEKHECVETPAKPSVPVRKRVVKKVIAEDKNPETDSEPKDKKKSKKEKMEADK